MSKVDSRSGAGQKGGCRDRFLLVVKRRSRKDLRLNQLIVLQGKCRVSKSE